MSNGSPELNMTNMANIENERRYLRNIGGNIVYSSMDLDLLKKACKEAIMPVGNMDDNPVLSGILRSAKFHNAINPHELLAVVTELEQARVLLAAFQASDNQLEGAGGAGNVRPPKM